MNNIELLAILDRISRTRVLIVGDVMLDRYWWGSASLSPEAPVPVVALREISNIPGGAANVAANISGLGASAVLAGLVGSDEAGASLRLSLQKHHISDEYLIASQNRPTTTKTRVLVHNQQIARIDDETDAPITAAEEAALAGSIEDLMPAVDAVVISDYAKGCLTDGLVRKVIELARLHGKFVVVDPKSRDLTKYCGASLITPNLAEAMNSAGIENGGEERACEAAAKILSETSVDSLLITLGEHGMQLFRAGEAPVHFSSLARQVFDVTGAGDTVVATLAAAVAAKADMHSAVSLANVAAGIAVEKVGTAIVGIEELRMAINDYVSHTKTSP